MTKLTAGQTVHRAGHIEREQQSVGQENPQRQVNQVNLQGRDLEDDGNSCPILGLSFLLWTSRGFVRAVDSNCLPWSPGVPQGLLQEGAG